MKGDVKIISYLNKLLGNELVAIKEGANKSEM